MAVPEKTNVCRLLDKAGAVYQLYGYDATDGHIDGPSVAAKIGQSPQRVFKTLVTRGQSGAYYVFVLPCTGELHLKAAAKAAGEKAVTMIPVAEINKVTGYIRGGCSPLGMKKQYKTLVDESCLGFESIVVSGGKIGTQIDVPVKILLELTGAVTAHIAQE